MKNWPTTINYLFKGRGTNWNGETLNLKGKLKWLKLSSKTGSEQKPLSMYRNDVKLLTVHHKTEKTFWKSDLTPTHAFNREKKYKTSSKYHAIFEREICNLAYTRPIRTRFSTFRVHLYCCWWCKETWTVWFTIVQLIKPCFHFHPNPFFSNCA